MTCEINDSEVDELIRCIRKSLGVRQSPSGLQAQAKLLVEAPAPTRDKLVSEVEDDEADSTTWSGVLWDTLTAAANGTKAAASCQELLQSEPAWEDMITLLCSRPVATEVVVTYPWCLKRVFDSLQLLLLGALIKGLPCFLGALEQALGFSSAVLTGRQKLLCLCSSLCLRFRGAPSPSGIHCFRC